MLEHFPPKLHGGQLGRGGKRGGAWEHCSQKELDWTILGRRILVKSAALVAIFTKKAIYRTSTAGPFTSIENIFHFEDNILKYREHSFCRRIWKWWIICYIFMSRIKSFFGSAVIRNFFCESDFSKWNPHFITLENSFYRLTRIWYLSEKFQELSSVK